MRSSIENLDSFGCIEQVQPGIEAGGVNLFYEKIGLG
jgi:hypothetical protein